MGIFDKGVKKTNRSFFDRLSRAIVGRTEVDDDVLDAIEEALLATDKYRQKLAEGIFIGVLNYLSQY